MCNLLLFLKLRSHFGLVVESIPQGLWYRVCCVASTSVSGPDGDLFQQTAKVLTLTPFYKESFQHEFDFVSNCDAHECLKSSAVIRALEAHSRLAFNAHWVGWSLLVSCSDITVDCWLTVGYHSYWSGMNLAILVGRVWAVWRWKKKKQFVSFPQQQTGL